MRTVRIATQHRRFLAQPSAAGVVTTQAAAFSTTTAPNAEALEAEAETALPAPTASKEGMQEQFRSKRRPSTSCWQSQPKAAEADVAGEVVTDRKVAAVELVAPARTARKADVAVMVARAAMLDLVDTVVTGVTAE